MEWQDVLSLILFLVLVTFSKKRKPSEEGDEVPSGEEPSFSDVDTVRKKIEALKRQRRDTPQEVMTSYKKPAKERPVFSAYKHLPQEGPILSIATPKISTEAFVMENPKDIVKSIDTPHKNSRLRDWVVGQVVLETPAYRRYGNFIHR